jgi:HK97 family phage major capsid protein
MSPYNSIIGRDDAAAFIPTEVAAEVIQLAAQQSAALTLCRTVPMSSKLKVQPVLSALPVAYFVNGDTGLKQTTEAAWQGLQLEAEEIAAIVPAPEAVIDDADTDVWAQLRPGLAEAVGAALDAAVFAGTNKPTTWPQAIVPGAVAAGNVATTGNTPAEGGVVGDLDETFDLVENDGYDVNGIAARRKMRSRLRKARDAGGQPLVDASTTQILGANIAYVAEGTFTDPALAVVGDYSMAVVGVRQDLTYKVLDQAVITDNAGAIVYNLPQQDMLALRVVARFGFAIAKPVSRNASGAGGFPFAVLNATP